MFENNIFLTTKTHKYRTGHTNEEVDLKNHPMKIFKVWKPNQSGMGRGPAL